MGANETQDPCPACGGTGYQLGLVCESCKGTGNKG